MEIQKNYFFSQVHQPFFLSGTIWAVIVMGLFGFMYHGMIISESSTLFFHAYSMILLVFTPFFIGFIFTTFPRFCQSPGIEKQLYKNLFFIYQIGSLLFIIGSIFNIYVTLFGIVILFMSHVAIVYQLQKIFTQGIASRMSSDPFWILIGFYFGLLAHMLFLLQTFFILLHVNIELTTLSATIGFWNYLIFVAFAVAQRMVPFFSHVMAEKNSKLSAVIFTFLCVKSVLSIFNLHVPEAFLDTATALFLLFEFRKWQLNTLDAPAILWVLHIALYWLVAGLFLGASISVLQYLGIVSTGFFELHLVAIGFLTTLLIGFGTRVTLGHSGQVPHADRYTTSLFLLVQFIVLMRAGFALFMQELWIFDITSIAWILLYILWIQRFAPTLISGKNI